MGDNVSDQLQYCLQNHLIVKENNCDVARLCKTATSVDTTWSADADQAC